ncbi:MAG: hypothetical protein IT318_17970 [Anaerolineales bacterium]|nr:hypothetical protein [Anaerolineales bacterium]
MHRRWLFVVVSLVGAVLACSSSGGAGPSSAERATSLAQTAAALLTSTAQASVTPATPTPLASNTPMLPTPTVTPPATPTLPPATATVAPTPCQGTNDSAFVADVSVPDGTHFAPGTSFTKTWRLRNDGECPWTTGYQLRPIGGDVMGGVPSNLTAVVPPGGTVDVSVALTAPASNGTHTGRWQLHGPDGTPFGTRPFVEVIVP